MNTTAATQTSSVTLPEWVFDECSGAAIKFMGALYRHHGTLRLNLDSVVRLLKTSRRQAVATIKELLKTGLIARCQSRDEVQRFDIMEYRLTTTQDAPDRPSIMIGRASDRTVKNDRTVADCATTISESGDKNERFPWENDDLHIMDISVKEGSSSSYFCSSNFQTSFPADPPPPLIYPEIAEENPPFLKAIQDLVDVVEPPPPARRTYPEDRHRAFPVYIDPENPDRKPFHLERKTRERFLVTYGYDAVKTMTEREPYWDRPANANNEQTACWLLEHPDAWTPRKKYPEPDDKIRTDFPETLARFSPDQLKRLEKRFGDPYIRRSMAWAAITLASGEKTPEDALIGVFSYLKNPGDWLRTSNRIPEGVSEAELLDMVKRSDEIFSGLRTRPEDGAGCIFVCDRISFMHEHSDETLINAKKQLLYMDNMDRKNDLSLMKYALKNGLTKPKDLVLKENAEFLERLRKKDGAVFNGVELQVSPDRVTFVFRGGQKAPVVIPVTDLRFIEKFKEFNEFRRLLTPEERLAQREPGFRENAGERVSGLNVIEHKKFIESVELRPDRAEANMLQEQARQAARKAEELPTKQVDETPPSSQISEENKAFLDSIRHLDKTFLGHLLVIVDDKSFELHENRTRMVSDRQRVVFSAPATRKNFIREVQEKIADENAKNAAAKAGMEREIAEIRRLEKLRLNDSYEGG